MHSIIEKEPSQPTSALPAIKNLRLYPVLIYLFNPSYAEENHKNSDEMGCRKSFSQGMWLVLPGTLGYQRNTMPFEYCVSMKTVPGSGKLSKLGLNLDGVLQVLPGKPEFFFRF